MKVQPRSTRAAPTLTQNGGAKITKKSGEKKIPKKLEEEKARILKEAKAAKAKILREEKAKFDKKLAKTLTEVEAEFAEQLREEKAQSAKVINDMKEHIDDLNRRNKINEALQDSKGSDIQRLETENRRLWGRIAELELDSVKPITYLVGPVDGR